MSLSQDMKVTSNFSKVNSINYNLAKSDAKLVKSQIIERLQCLQNSVKKSGSKITFQIPASNRYLDLASVFFTFKNRSTVTNAVANDISQAFSELKISDGYGTVLSNVQNYAELSSMFQTFMSEQYKVASLSAEGWGGTPTDEQKKYTTRK